MDRSIEIDDRELKPLAALEKHGIAFIRLVHDPSPTMELCEGIGEKYGAKHCKNLFLASRNGKRFCLLLMESSKPFVTSEVSKKLGLPRMCFGSREQLMEILGLEGGAVSVLGIVNESAKRAYSEGKLIIAADSGLLAHEYMLVHPNVNTSSLVIRTKDVVEFAEKEGFELKIIEV